MANPEMSSCSNLTAPHHQLTTTTHPCYSCIPPVRQAASMAPCSRKWYSTLPSVQPHHPSESYLQRPDTLNPPGHEEGSPVHSLHNSLKTFQPSAVQAYPNQSQLSPVTPCSTPDHTISSRSPSEGGPESSLHKGHHMQHLGPEDAANQIAPNWASNYSYYGWPSSQHASFPSFYGNDRASENFNLASHMYPAAFYNYSAAQSLPNIGWNSVHTEDVSRDDDTGSRLPSWDSINIPSIASDNYQTSHPADLNTALYSQQQELARHVILQQAFLNRESYHQQLARIATTGRAYDQGFDHRNIAHLGRGADVTDQNGIQVELAPPLSHARSSPAISWTSDFRSTASLSSCAKTSLKDSCTVIKTPRGDDYQCTTCNQLFTTTASYNKHCGSSKCLASRRIYRCNVCHKLFNHKKVLVVHRRVHTGERPHQCQYCEQSFSDTSSKTKHERTHTKEKPYQCSECGTRFTQSGNLKRHLRNIHKLAV